MSAGVRGRWAGCIVPHPSLPPSPQPSLSPVPPPLGRVKGSPLPPTPPPSLRPPPLLLNTNTFHLLSEYVLRVSRLPPRICGLRIGCGKNGNSYICFSGRLRLPADHNPPSSHTQGARRQRKHSSAEIHKEPLCVSLPMGPADHDTNPRGSSATCNCRHFGASQA